MDLYNEKTQYFDFTEVPGIKDLLEPGTRCIAQVTQAGGYYDTVDRYGDGKYDAPVYALKTHHCFIGFPRGLFITKDHENREASVYKALDIISGEIKNRLTNENIIKSSVSKREDDSCVVAYGEDRRVDFFQILTQMGATEAEIGNNREKVAKTNTATTLTRILENIIPVGTVVTQETYGQILKGLGKTGVRGLEI